MVPSSPSLEAQVRALQDRVEAVESRLASIERRAPPAAAVPGPAGDLVEQLIGPLPGVSFDPVRVVVAFGRALIILGGAFLLRALTEAGVWPRVVGVSIGWGYAVVWLWTSASAATRRDRVRALFDGATAFTIGFPLIVEAALKFSLLSPPAAAALLAAFAACTLVSAGASRHAGLAWIATLAAATTGLFLMVRTGVLLPFSLYFTFLGVATLWLGYLRDLRGARWLMGPIAAGAVLVITQRALRLSPLESPQQAWLCQGVLVVAYLGSIAVRTLIRGRQVIAFEVSQTALALIVGLGGALTVVRAAGTGAGALGAGIVVLGLGTYVLSYQFLARQAPAARNFYFYSALALIFLMTGTWIAVSGVVRAVAFLSYSVLLAFAWSRWARVTLGVHTAATLLAAAAVSGLATFGRAAFWGSAPAVGSWWLAGLILALACALLASDLAVVGDGRLAVRDWPALAIAGVATVGGTALVLLGVLAAVAALGGRPDLLEPTRTAVLSGAAIGLAWIAGKRSALARLAYPLLAVTGLKVAAIDLVNSTAGTLVVTLACYGAALLLVPRLRRAAP